MGTLRQFENHRGELYATVRYNHDVDAIEDIWVGNFGRRQAFRDVLTFVRDYVVEHGCLRWLADLRGMQGSWASLQSWVANEVMPPCIQAGLRYEAVVLPEDVFASVSTNNTIKMIGNYELRQFDDYDLASQWLRSCTAPPVA